MSVVNCPKHGVQYPDYFPASCPMCRQLHEQGKDLAGHYEEINAFYEGQRDRPTLSPQADAVLKAAEGLVGGDRDTVPGWNRPDRYVLVPKAEWCALQDTIRAYRASLQPQGVRPDEVRPGEWFSFEGGTGTKYMMVEGHRYVGLDGKLKLFSIDDFIIPLPKEQ